MIQWFLVFVGGGVGSALRFLLSKSLAFNPENHFFPYGTLLANVLSSFILGIVIQKHINAQLNEQMKWLLAIGFCGGFSTFSTFAYEFYQYITKGQLVLGIVYVLISILLTLGAVFAGIRTVM